MGACVEAARANNEGDAKKTQRKNAIKACKSKAKEVLKDILGKIEISDEKLEVFKLKNAKKEIADLRSACMDTATVEEDKKKCVDEGRDLLKKTLASVLGKDDDVTAEDVEETVVEGASVVAANIAAACMEEKDNAGRRLDKHRACFAGVKTEIAKALGVDDIDVEEAQELLEKGAGSFIGHNIAACIDGIQSNSKRRLDAHAACFSKAKLKALAEKAVGQPISESDIDGAGVRGQLSAAVDTAREAMEGAKSGSDNKLSKTKIREFVDEAIAKASGIAKKTDLTGGGRLARLKEEAGFDAIAVAGKACDRTKAEKCDIIAALKQTSLADSVDLTGAGADVKRIIGEVKRG